MLLVILSFPIGAQCILLSLLVSCSKIWSSLENPSRIHHPIPNFWFLICLNRLVAGLKGTRDSPLWLWGVQAMKFLFIGPNRLSHSSNHSWLGVQCPCNPVHTATCNLYCYNWFYRWPSSKFHLNQVQLFKPHLFGNLLLWLFMYQSYWCHCDSYHSRLFTGSAGACAYYPLRKPG